MVPLSPPAGCIAFSVDLLLMGIALASWFSVSATVPPFRRIPECSSTTTLLDLDNAPGPLGDSEISAAVSLSAFLRL